MSKHCSKIILVCFVSNTAFALHWYDYEDPDVGLTAKILVMQELSYAAASEECGRFGQGWGLPTIDDFGPGAVSKVEPKTERFMSRIGFKVLPVTSPGHFYIFWSGYEVSSTRALGIWRFIIFKTSGLFGDELDKSSRFGVVCTYHAP